MYAYHPSPSFYMRRGSTKVGRCFPGPVASWNQELNADPEQSPCSQGLYCVARSLWVPSCPIMLWGSGSSSATLMRVVFWEPAADTPPEPAGYTFMKPTSGGEMVLMEPPPCARHLMSPNTLTGTACAQFAAESQYWGTVV